jgi:tetratricopeptide (TPR) repeat protein
MDCRASVVLALGLVGSVVGCTPQATFPLVPSGTPVEPPAQSSTADGEPKRMPRPATCVAAGQFREQEADNPEVPPAVKEQLREQARKAYQQAIAIDPNYLPAHRGLARLYETMGDHEHAIATYEKVVLGHPKEAAVWYDLGMCHGRHKEWDKALTALGQAAALDPENRPYANTLGFCLARAGQFDESLACFQKFSGPAKAHYSLAEMQHHMKQDELAKEQLRLALEADPQLAAARDLLARIERKAPDANPPAAVAGFDGFDGEAPAAQSAYAH